MISASSRYAGDVVTSAVYDGNVINVIILPQPQASTITYVSHMVTDQDRLDNLAYRYFGDPTMWWAIADANADTVGIDWTSLAPGTVIRIPMK